MKLCVSVCVYVFLYKEVDWGEGHFLKTLGLQCGPHTNVTK